VGERWELAVVLACALSRGEEVRTVRRKKRRGGGELGERRREEREYACGEAE
jgi:LmbE family N-acetylglucosaminyl deacetylase